MSVHVAVRSYLTAGVAVVGASALIAAPLAVPPPEIHLPAIHASSAEVQLAALANPIAEWVTVVQTTFANVAALGVQFQNDPAPILAQLLKNQLANASTLATALEGTVGVLGSQVAALPSATLLAAQQLAAGQFSAAVGTLFQAGIGLILGPAISLIGATSIITDGAQRFANVVAAIPNALLPVGLAAISPIAGAVYSFGDAGQAVIDAARKGDVAGALSALANIPAIVTNAFLNGYPPQFTTGIFSPLVDGGGFGSGLIATLLDVRNAFAKALSSAVPPAASAASLPTSAKLISLTEAPTDSAQVGETAARSGATTASVTTEAATEPATDVTTAPTAPVVTEPVAATTEPVAATTEPATEPVTAATEPAASTPAESAGDTTKSESASAGTSSSTESTGTESSSSSTSSKPSTKPTSTKSTSTKSSNDDKAPSSSGASSSGASSSSASSDATKSTSASTGSTGKPASSKKDSSAGSANSGSEGSGASSAS